MDMGSETQPLAQVDLDIPIGIVVGHEGEGIRHLVSKRCDILLELPMRGHVESLNAAVAGSVLLYMAWQARGYK
jgi:23S rRNA (guanosine2251-2'-O)-methyltransferase